MDRSKIDADTRFARRIWNRRMQVGGRKHDQSARLGYDPHLRVKRDRLQSFRLAAGFGLTLLVRGRTPIEIPILVIEFVGGVLKRMVPIVTYMTMPPSILIT